MKAAVRLMLVLALAAPSFASAQGTTPPAPTCQLQASATTVNYNTRVRLNWSTNNATSGYLSDVGVVGPNGFAYVVPGKNTTYTASFTGPGGSVVCRVGIAVVQSGAGAPINTNIPVNLDYKVTLPDVTLPTVPSVVQTSQPSGGTGFSGGIVPAECRGKSTVANCDLCSLAQMVQNLAYFLLGLTVPLAALLFAWAGILYFSARGNPEQIGKAHKVFKTVAIGFIIAISAWVLITTVMSVMVHGGDYKSWDWRNLNCDQTRKARLYNMKLSDYLKTSLPTLSGYTNPAPILSGGSAFGTECTFGGSMSVTESGNTCITSGGYTYPASNPGANPGGCAVGGSLTSENVCVRDDGFVYTPGTGSSNSVNGGTVGGGGAGSGGVGASLGGASCPSGYIYTSAEGGYCENPNNPDDWVEANGTSNSAAVGRRGVAQCPDGNPNCSISYLQSLGLSLTEARTASCIAMTENAGNAVGCSGTGPCGTFQISRGDWNRYAPADCRPSNFGGNITAAQNNGSCNARTMVIMVEDRGWQPWTGNMPGQAPWNPAARTCVSNYDPENL